MRCIKVAWHTGLECSGDLGSDPNLTFSGWAIPWVLGGLCVPPSEKEEEQIEGPPGNPGLIG